MSVPVFITCRDRVTDLRALLAWLERAESERVYLVDNDSAWPPLLEFYEETPHQVIRLDENLGHLAPWLSGAVARLANAEPYVVTDPDVVPDEGCPLDAIGHLVTILDRFPVYRKAGLGLRIDDLPAHYPARASVQAWEARFWRRPLERGLFHAHVDTTFAVYRAGWGPGYEPALRTGPPYVARHMPWYADGTVDEEEAFYRSRSLGSTWSTDRPLASAKTRRSPIKRLKWEVYKRRHIMTPLGRGRPGPVDDPSGLLE